MESGRPEFTRHVNDEFKLRPGRTPHIQRLDVAATATRETVASEGWQAIQQILGREMLQVDAELERSEVLANHASVAERLGYRRGLAAAARAAASLLARHTEVMAEQIAQHERGGVAAER